MVLMTAILWYLFIVLIVTGGAIYYIWICTRKEQEGWMKSKNKVGVFALLSAAIGITTAALIHFWG